MSHTIVVAGGGITGLAAAYQLQKHARTAGIDAQIILVEKDDRLGGKTQTDLIDGMVIEQGPDSYLAYKPWFGALAKELGLKQVSTNPAIRSTYIVHKGRMEQLPVGMNIMIPTEVWPFLKTRLLTLRGKLRAGLEPFIPRKTDDSDESIGSFVGRRFGQEVLDTVAGPLMGGIHGGDWEAVSIKATFPTFTKMEREGSLLLQGWKNKANKPKGPTGSAFATVPTGLQSVVEALVNACDGVTFKLKSSLTELKRVGGGYQVKLDSGERIDADAVVLALPAFVTAGLIKTDLPGVAGELEQIPYNNSVVVAMAYNRTEIDHPLNASGFLVPHTEPLDVTAATWVSSKWLHSAPPDKALFRCFLGRGFGKDWTAESDEAITAAVRLGLNQTMGLTAEPILVRIYRWAQANPQYRVGHLERIDRIDRQMAEVTGLYLAGAAFRGVGLGDCVREGNQAADKAARQLGWMK